MSFVELGIEDGLPWASADILPDVDFYITGEDEVQVVTEEGNIVRTFSINDAVTSLDDLARTLERRLDIGE